LKVDLRLWLHVSSEKQPCRDRYSVLSLYSDIVTAVKVVGSAYKPSPPACSPSSRNTSKKFSAPRLLSKAPKKNRSWLADTHVTFLTDSRTFGDASPRRR
ncbi:hypothetical protein AVEN_200270-1, partial [Araneus ventricosus]